MSLINLLPHRETARKHRREVFYRAWGASAVVGVLVAGTGFLWYRAEISAQQLANSMLSGETVRLEGQIKEIAGLESEIAALKARQQAVEDLQSDRNLPVHLLAELAAQLPQGVFLTKMEQIDQSVTIAGTAQSNERVSELLNNLGTKTPWFAKPELVEIVAGAITLPSKEQKRVANFVIRVRMVRANEVERSLVPPAGAPAKP